VKPFRLSCLLVAALAVAGIAQAANTTQAALSWTAPTAFADGSAITGTITYNVYQGPTGALVKVQTGVTSPAATVTSGLTAGTTQCFAVTAVINSIESAQSNTACAAIPFPTPGAPTNVVVVISGS
jgi:hypothetical protein